MGLLTASVLITCGYVGDTFNQMDTDRTLALTLTLTLTLNPLMNQMFHEMDANGDGSISKEELQSYIEAQPWGDQMSHRPGSHWADLFSSMYDTNGDGDS